MNVNTEPNIIQDSLSEVNNIVVRWGDLDHSKKTPILNYCRKLVRQGFPETARLDILYDDKDEIRVSALNIGAAAKLTVIENDKTGPVFSKYHPHPLSQKGVS